MKISCIIHYVLAILEGAVSGACFYRARQAKETRQKTLLFISSALWFACSLVSSLQGGQELREMINTDGGNDND